MKCLPPATPVLLKDACGLVNDRPHTLEWSQQAEPRMTTGSGRPAPTAGRSGAMPEPPAAHARESPAGGLAAPPGAAARRPRVAILGSDAALELALREGAAGVSFVTAHTPTALADVLGARPCDALIVDVTALGATPSRTLALLAGQFPDLPIVAVGSRSDEAAVAGLISSGQVYRFLHRPLSPERARSLLGAALRRRTRTSGLPTSPGSAAVLAGAIVLALLALLAWWMLGASSR